MTCSIGVGCNKTVAKIASERDKPFGLTIVRPGTEQRFLAALPVSAMSGIGRSAEERLRRMRIYTLGELSRAPESTLASIFGVNGERMRQRALGLEISEVTSLDEEREVKSVSNERTFAKDLTERGDIEAAIALLGESVGRRLRRQGTNRRHGNAQAQVFVWKRSLRHSAGCLIRPTMRTSSWRLHSNCSATSGRKECTFA